MTEYVVKVRVVEKWDVRVTADSPEQAIKLADEKWNPRDEVNCEMYDHERRVLDDPEEVELYVEADNVNSI